MEKTLKLKLPERKSGKMQLSVIGSSSDGNCYLLMDGEHYIALDCGRPFDEVRRGCNYTTSCIEAAIISHEHTDHVSNIKDFFRQGIDCYTGDKQAENIGDTRLKTLPEKKWSDIYGWKILPFSIPHDEVPNFAYVIKRNDHTICYATDFEYLPFTLKSFGITTWLIECNHSIEIEQFANSKNYEHVLRGHSSLETVKSLLALNITESTKNIICCHLSSRNSDADQIITELTDIVPETVNVKIARKGLIVDLEGS